MVEDVLTLEGDPQEGEPLITEVMSAGKRLAPAPPLSFLRERTARDLARLPPSLLTVVPSDQYPVRISSALKDLAAAVDNRLAAAEATASPLSKAR
jgi:nicotinate phosphoribosyltransferase